MQDLFWIFSTYSFASKLQLDSWEPLYNRPHWTHLSSPSPVVDATYTRSPLVRKSPQGLICISSQICHLLIQSFLPSFFSSILFLPFTGYFLQANAPSKEADDKLSLGAAGKPGMGDPEIAHGGGHSGGD